MRIFFSVIISLIRKKERGQKPNEGVVLLRGQMFRQEGKQVFDSTIVATNLKF